MPKFCKKPVVIEALFFSPDTTWEEIRAFCPDAISQSGHRLVIPTLEGLMNASVGDWIIKGIKGEFYPCKPDIFDAIYTPVETPDVD